ncbi:MAG: FAD-binding protein, partial [Candidatus Omnitrophica bacterium]|nr:FAD-binding protein [Candidatus Omnitrophota bacterium]
MTTFENELRSRFGERLQTNASLKPYTTLRIGGPARFLIEVEKRANLIEAYRLALNYRIPFYFLAGCSNVLISDDGLPGLAVINRCRSIEWRGDRTVRIEGGCSLDRFVTELSKRGWADLSFAAGIPGSVGGALAGGAGAYGRLVCEYLQQADVLHCDGGVETMAAEGLGIQYRSSEA